ncbi:MAG: hypothetical protein AAB482_02805 [Patescibacteria group bacterium]
MEERPQFESPEAEIKYLEQKILEKKRELAEHDSRGVVAETLKEHIAEIPVVAAPVAPANQNPKDDNTLEKNVALYVQMAFQDGISSAVQQIRNTHNPFLIDAFHDALTDRFLDALRAKGLLETNG